ncbi:molybdopterin-dependent oxidoreductase [Bermanella sp. WJH001]|uniref:nitrate reductase n=1 Tax=Bermanella sp. WJH001 TaxID=3048005 RepID=UPI0024BDE0E9|nr:nitrate reductase [Bermanella sp. WJH001]MDJ1539562.1 molybdopterin-dependent oxidoreductase [Bermanella sp. WJH001]
MSVITSTLTSKNTNETTKHTTCAYCGVGCGIKATINEAQRSIRVSGLDHHPANLGRLCSKGSALDQTVSLNERLLEPKINNQVVSWDEALDKVANGFSDIIKQHGPDAVAFYVSGQLLTEDYYVANKLMKGYIGSGNIDTNSRLCMSSSVVGHKRAFGTDTVPGCYDDFEKAELITLVGSNTAWCHPVLFQRIKKYKEANPNVKVVVIDPRRTQTCDIADLHLPLNLGTDVWLFNGLLNSINQQNKINSDYVQQYCEGLDEAINTAQQSAGDIKALANTLGVNEDDLKQFYNWFCNTEKSVTLYSQGVNQSSSGTDKVNSILNCHLATGRIGKPGMGPFSMTGQPNAMGGREVGGLANTLAAHMDFTQDSIARVKTFWQSPTMATQSGLMAVDMFDAIDEGKIKAVWVMATNPVVSLPNADKVKRALKKCELVVISDCIDQTDTGDLAHVKLPATGWSEKDGTVTNSERRISRQRGLFQPACNAMHDWQIICDVAKRMGFADGFNYQNQAEIFREHAALSGFENSDAAEHRRRDFDISGLANISNDEYENLAPIQWPVNAQYPKGRERFFAQGDFFTPNRKAKLLAITPKLPVNLPSNDYPLRLNTGRIRDQWHTMTRTALAPQLNQHISQPYVEMHANDAKSRNLIDGQLVSVKSKWGNMLAPVSINQNPKQGDIFVPMHWTAQLSRTGRINPVVNPEVDAFSKQPESKHTPVQVNAYNANWFGFVLSRNPIQWPDSEYVVSAQGNQHTRLELAHSEKLESPIKAMMSWLGFDSIAQIEQQELEILSFEDAASGLYRLALMNKQGQLEAVAMVAPNTQLPERTWLASQFAKQNLDERARMALLSGHAPAGEDIGRIVCACYSVGEKTIAAAVKAGCKTPAMVGDKLKAGTNCGSCVPEIKGIIAKG